MRAQSSPLSVVLALDGSPCSQAAARLLCDLPLPPGSAVIGLTVLEPRHGVGRHVLEAALDEARSLLPHRELQVSTEVLPGHPSEVLTRWAHDQAADLILLGARGHRLDLPGLLGSVAQRVVEHADRPVLIVRAPYTGLRRVLLAVDASPRSAQAVDFLSRFPLPPETELHVVHVLLPVLEPAALVYVSGLGAGPGPVPETELGRLASQQAASEQRQGEQLVARVVARLHNAGRGATGHLVWGEPAAELLRYARDHFIDVIVAGSRGLGSLSGWWLGSVSRKLVQHAACAVLIVKGAPHGPV